jgi:hypothetical protein
VSVTISNVGTRPTTINGIGMEILSNLFIRLGIRAGKTTVYPNPSDGFPLPRVLNPGEEWLGLILQEQLDKGDDLTEMSRTGHLMICLSQFQKQ